MDVCLLIPAYNPEPILLRIIQQLLHDFCHIIVVDDGSSSQNQSIFDDLPKDQITILQHEQNQGKGAALQSGIRHWQENYQHLSHGLVTADADGQHAVEDIRAIGKALQAQPGHLHLGVRNFSQDIPFRSAFGNQVTRAVFKLITKISLRDSQTGLRGIPGTLIESILGITSQGYEYETLMLLKTFEQHIPIDQHPIQTIYIDQNRSSHFKPIRDSYRIYKSLIQFTMTGKCGD